MLTKPIDEIVAKYPWPPLSHPAALRQLLGFMSQDPELNDSRHVAYMLATCRHETAFTYLPIAEYGHGAGHSYGEPDPGTGQTYYGRGYVQLTWRENYEKFGRLLHLDLVNDPDQALEPDIAYKILSLGMRQGLFTGKKLSDFIHHAVVDYRNARRIINGTDCADKIAGYATQFERVLTSTGGDSA